MIKKPDAPVKSRIEQFKSAPAGTSGRQFLREGKRRLVR